MNERSDADDELARELSMIERLAEIADAEAPIEEHRARIAARRTRGAHPTTRELLTLARARRNTPVEHADIGFFFVARVMFLMSEERLDAIFEQAMDDGREFTDAEWREIERATAIDVLRAEAEAEMADLLQGSPDVFRSRYESGALRAGINGDWPLGD